MLYSYTLEDCPDCLRKKGKSYKVLEIYAGFEPTDFNVEKYIYFCKHCGRTIKRLRNLSPKVPDKYFKIEFIDNEIMVTEL